MGNFLGGRITDTIGSRGGRHKGIDIATPIGSEVNAPPGNWTVEQAGVHGGYGKKVTLRNATTGGSVIYGHLDDILVKMGQQVVSGELVGFSGNTGKSTGPHVHLEAHNEAGDIVNPLSLYGSAAKGSIFSNMKAFEKPLKGLTLSMARLAMTINNGAKDLRKVIG